MSSSRILSIRSYCLGLIAALGAIVFIALPAHARSIDVMEPGYHAPSIAHLEKSLVMHEVVETVAIVERSHDATIVDVAVPSAPLKPEYAASYDTHGLNFIDLRRRC